MFTSWWRNLRRAGPRLSRGERREPGRLGRGNFRPRLEVLEDRTTPTIVFDPHFGAESAHDNGGYKLAGDPVYLIFWGSAWNGATPDMGSVATAFTNVLLDPATGKTSAYFSALAQYGTNGSVAYVHQYFDPSGVKSGFTDDDVQGVITNAIDHGLPEPDANGHNNALYVVITPPGVMSGDHSGDAGYNAHYHYGGIDIFDLDEANYAWVSVPAVSTPAVPTNVSTKQQALDAASTLFSHEVVEAMTDPEQGNGIVVTPPSSLPANVLAGNSSPDQIADFEPEPGGQHH